MACAPFPVVPHLFINRGDDKAVDTLSLRFCVGLDFILAAFWHTNPYFIQFFKIFGGGFPLSFADWHTRSPFRGRPKLLGVPLHLYYEYTAKIYMCP